MKHFYMRHFLLCLCLLAGIKVSAYDALIDGIYYNLSGNEASVTFQDDNGMGYFYSDYSGDIFIPESVTYDGTTYSVTSIGARAFYYCHNLISITIPGSVTSIGSEAFQGCSGLTSITIPNNVTSIGYSAFAYCHGLTSITIPESVTSIGDWAFQSCTALTSIKVEEGNTCYDSRNDCNAIIETASNTLIVGCSNTIIPESVTSIGEAFIGCTNLTSITIPENVISISTNAFASCTGLTSVTIPESVEYLRDNAFYGCYFVADSLINKSTYPLWESGAIICDEETGDGLLITNNEVVFCRPFATSVIIPDDVTSIAQSAFRYNYSLTSVTIGNGVTSIYSESFYDCSNLTSVTIPNSVTSIGPWAFANCNALEAVHITDLSAWCNISFEWYYLEDILDISSNPLIYAHHLYLDGQEIKDLVIPDDVTTIGELAFVGCSGLTSVTIPESVTSIGNYAFMECNGLTAVHITDLAAWCNITYLFSYYPSPYSQPLYYAHHLYLDGQEIKDLVIPDGVTTIGELAFVGCSGLTSVTIPESVTYIGYQAFAGCFLASFVNNSALSSEDYQYWGAILYDEEIGDGLLVKDNFVVGYRGTSTSVNIPEGVTGIYSGVFYERSDLTSITIPEGVTIIGPYAFYGCTGLTSITIPNSVTSIGESAFFGCTGLISVNIPEDLTEIEYGVFSSCRNLISITIPNSVTSIGNSAFYYCDSLTSVSIGSGVTSIGDYAFADCSGLKEIYCYAEETPKVMESYDWHGTFADVDVSKVMLVVPDGAVEKYKAHPVWGQFWIETPTDINLATSPVGKESRYDLNGLKLDKPQRGVNIIRYSDGTTRKVLVK